MPYRSGSPTTRKRILLGSIAAFACTAIAISVIIAGSILHVTENANSLDNDRSRSTVSAALAGVKGQIIGVTRDNSIWDDAAQAAYIDNDTQWMIDNWGLTTKDYPLYNEVVVVDSNGTPIIAYENGVPFDWTPEHFYGPSFRYLLDQNASSKKTGNDTRFDSAFVMTPQGLTIISVGPILPSSLDLKVEPGKRLFLVFSRQVRSEDIESLGNAYVVPGLEFATVAQPGKMSASVHDATGATIGHLVWPPRNPGNMSFQAVRPNLLVALSLFIALLFGFAGYTRFLVGNMRRDKRRAEYEATHDPLSDLLNRAGLFRKLDRLLAQRQPSEVSILVYMDLDGFKDVNDTYGHAVGDSLIRHVADRLERLAPTGSDVARLGGDEFAILLRGEQASAANADLFTSSIHCLFREPFDLDGRTIVVGASIGTASIRNEKVDSTELVRRADLAMYRAKDMGRGRTVEYEYSFDADRSAQNQLEVDLRLALENDQLDIAFQPLVDAKSGKWHGVEALARWYNCRISQTVSPDVFIPLAERSGLIETLGLQILRKALMQSGKWPGLKMSVNVSPAQFRNPAFPDHVARIIDETGVDPSILTLEITEGFFVRNPERAQRIVQALKKLGVSISLDDFGSGFSSIGYLRQFEFDRLKIDRSFISALDTDANATSVIQATVALANAFNIPVTAEGIESEEQAVVLRLSGCDELQGYLFGRPMPAAEIDRIIAGKPDKETLAA